MIRVFVILFVVMGGATFRCRNIVWRRILASLAFTHIIAPGALDGVIVAGKNPYPVQPSSPKVEDQRHRRLRRLEIVEHLCAFIVGQQMGKGFDFYDHRAFDKKIEEKQPHRQIIVDYLDAIMPLEADVTV